MTNFYGIGKNIIKPEKFKLPEESLNLLLRRADWRFLMSNPDPKKTICFAVGELAKAVNLISDSVIDGDSDYTGDDCDLAVLINPDQVKLKAAWSALKTGGSCYIEWDVQPYARPQSVRTKLRNSGFDEISLYLPNPPPDHSITNVWFPLEDSKAIGFYINDSSRKNTKSIIARVKGVLRRLGWFLCSKLFITYPWFLTHGFKNYIICSLAYKSNFNESVKSFTTNTPSASNADPYILISENYRIDTLESKLKSLGVCHHSNKVSILMRSTGDSIYNKAILLVFSGTSNEPSLLVKRSRIAESAFHLANEANVLRTIRENHGYIPGVPNLLFISQDSGSCTVGESFIEGVPIMNIRKRKNYRELALKATKFQIKLAEYTKIKAPIDWRDNIIKPVISYFTSSFNSVLDNDLIQKSNDIMNDLQLTQLVCEHRDFSPWNILINSDRELGVIDWEGSTLQGLPAVDLINCLTYLSFYLDNNWEPSRFSECYRRMLDENSFEGTVFKECLTSYCDNIGLPFSMIPSLRLFAWINALNWEYYALGNYSDSPTNPEAIRHLIHFGIWKEEVQHTEKQRD